MQLKIVHTTGFEYDDHVTASYNEARLSPQNRAGQIVTQTRIEVRPTPWMQTYRDHWGTTVTAFEVLARHNSLKVVGTSVVHTSDSPRQLPPASWTDVEENADTFAEYLIMLPRVEPPPDLIEKLDSMRSESDTPSDAANKICALIYAEVTYQAGSTQVQTTAASAWAQRSGVCQDIAHLVVGSLRHLGIPARYVSGYLHPSRSPEVGESVLGESHAWVEWWDGEWCGFDPTNNIPPGERHVVVAVGRHYDDVRPLSGVFSGLGNTKHMEVDVQITRLA